MCKAKGDTRFNRQTDHTEIPISFAPHVCLSINVALCMRMQRSEADFWDLFLSCFYTLFFEMGCLTEPGVH